ncbi:MAG: hypothetical protein D6748_14770 [Calditrichaeota bacterium]|nr:MAG: hypothetical protein D6748_14770 [Calditrichota bacterium]
MGRLKSYLILLICSTLIFTGKVKSQYFDLDLFINDSLSTGIQNLHGALISGMNSMIIQRIDSQSRFQFNLSLSQNWIHISRDEQTGPLTEVMGFGFPMAQLEVGLPSDFHLIARGMVYRMGEQPKETVLFWGMGFRYAMLHQQQNSNIFAGVLLLYEELNNINDFRIQSLMIKGYLGGGGSILNVYVTPGFTRSWYHVHPDQNAQIRFTRIKNFLKFNGGMIIKLNKRFQLLGNIVFGEFLTIGAGANITIW